MHYYVLFNPQTTLGNLLLINNNNDNKINLKMTNIRQDLKSKLNETLN